MHNRIRTVIVDDEPVARRGLRRLLSTDRDIDIVAECRSGREAAVALREQQPDLVFLDVEMPGVDGFACLEAVNGERPPVIVFVTAYDGYAARAFEVHAFDYVLKPFTDRRFRAVVERAKVKIRREPYLELGERVSALMGAFPALSSSGSSTSPRSPSAAGLTIQTDDRVVVISFDDIDWVEARDYYVRVHTGAGSILARQSLDKLQAALPGNGFLRVHRSAIVNLNRIVEVRPASNGRRTLVLRDGTRLPVSRGRRPALEAAIGRV